jgi:hypothetical protein
MLQSDTHEREEIEMGTTSSQVTEELYGLIQQLPRFNHLTPRERLPDNAVYLFFERGETAGFVAPGWAH